MSHRWTVYVTPKSPKGWHKTRFCYFFSKFQLLLKKVCCKVSSCENFQRQSCSYIIRSIDGLRTMSPSTKNLRSNWPTPSENADFEGFCVIVLQPWELARIAIIANRKSTTRFPSSHRWTLCITPNSPKGWLKTRILALPFISSLQVIVDISNLIRGLNIASPSLQMTNRPWKGRGHCHVTSLIFGKSAIISGKRYEITS